MKKLITAVVLAASFTNAFAGIQEVKEAIRTTTNSPEYAFAVVAAEMKTSHRQWCGSKKFQDSQREYFANQVEEYLLGNHPTSPFRGFGVDIEDEELFIKELRKVNKKLNMDVFWEEMIEWREGDTCGGLEYGLEQIGIKVNRKGQLVNSIKECQKIDSASESSYCYLEKYEEWGTYFAKGKFREVFYK